MIHKHRFLSITIIILLVSLACSGVGDPPAEPPTSLPVSTATSQPGSGPNQPGDLETVSVAQIVDGDTIELTDGRRVRYIGINTPERNQPYYEEATQANQQLVGGKEVGLEIDVETFDQYGRTLAYIWVDGMLANLEIVRRGFANAFTVPPNVRYEQEFRAAEREARDAGRGLWAGSEVALKIIHIEANAPGDDRQNPNGEWIGITVRPGASFRLYSGQGQNSERELYWGLAGESVWNNDSDAAFLRDAQGALVDTFAY
jgi:micrococcal nuclease